MTTIIRLIAILLLALGYAACQQSSTGKERAPEPVAEETLVILKLGDIPLPEGYSRISTDSNSFTHFLRQLPIRQNSNTVYLYNGDEKGNQSAQYRVIDLPVGDKNLQQCADVCMRLWADYLRQQKRYEDIHFNFLSDGKPRYYTEKVGTDRSETAYRDYMEWIFNYSNTRSLFSELETVEVQDLQPGDIFIKTGNPYGHAVMVADMAENAQGKKVFLLVQGYMPAQDIHVLNNFEAQGMSPWYSTNFGDNLRTPEYYFNGNYAIKRFQ